jgi:hypothetical protein
MALRLLRGVLGVTTSQRAGAALRVVLTTMPSVSRGDARLLSVCYGVDAVSATPEADQRTVTDFFIQLISQVQSCVSVRRVACCVASLQLFDVVYLFCGFCVSDAAGAGVPERRTAAAVGAVAADVCGRGSLRPHHRYGGRVSASPPACTSSASLAESLARCFVSSRSSFVVCRGTRWCCRFARRADVCTTCCSTYRVAPRISCGASLSTIRSRWRSETQSQRRGWSRC